MNSTKTFESLLNKSGFNISEINKALKKSSLKNASFVKQLDTFKANLQKNIQLNIQKNLPTDLQKRVLKNQEKHIKQFVQLREDFIKAALDQIEKRNLKPLAEALVQRALFLRAEFDKDPIYTIKHLKTLLAQPLPHETTETVVKKQTSKDSAKTATKVNATASSKSTTDLKFKKSTVAKSAGVENKLSSKQNNKAKPKAKKAKASAVNG